MDPDLWTYCGVIYDCFFMMYLINNEYTAKGEQPIQGILCLDDKDAAAKLHYLAREWQYFPESCLHLRC